MHRSPENRSDHLPSSTKLPAVRSLFTLTLVLVSAQAFCQAVQGSDQGPFMLSEDIGLAMSKAQVMEAAQDAWNSSFGQEPHGQLSLVDMDNGLLEGSARFNYRSKLLMGREETMGAVTYQVTIQARNGQCLVRVHNLKHTGNRAAQGGGINVGTIMEGVAPEEHYPGVGLSASRRMHADVREAASVRLRDAMRRFAARLRLLSGQ